MKPSTINASIYTDFQGLAELRRAAKGDQQAALRKVAQQFEAMFLQMMLKSMREAQLGDGIFDSDQSRLYQDMYDKQIGLNLSQKGALGLTDVLMRQLGGLLPPSRSSDAAAKGQALLRPAASVGTSAGKQPQANSPAGFVAMLWPHAERAAQRLGVQPRTLVAQAALETGWGKSVMTRSDGQSSHNLFGIKAGSSWQGDRVVLPTLEYEEGIARKQSAAFRAYGSYAEAFDDYVDLLQSRPRYAQALAQAHNPEGFARGLQQGGYATDPAYADKILSIYHGETLNQTVAALKNPWWRSLT